MAEVKGTKQQPVSTGKRHKSDYCPHDGAILVTDGPRRGYCSKADGYPLMRWFWHDEERVKWQAQPV